MASAVDKPITFVTNRVCPFAHRAWLSLEFHKQAGALDYEVKSASLSDKPAWFTEIYQAAIGADKSSNGKVPVIQDADGTILTESSIIAKYIDDKYSAKSGASLEPPSAIQRAQVQLFVEATAGPLIRAFYTLLKEQDASLHAEQSQKFTDALKGIGARLLEHDATLEGGAAAGGLFMGGALTFADILVWPWVRRISALTKHRGYTVPAAADDAQLARFAAWQAAVEAHPAVKGTFEEGDEEYYAEQYNAYANPK